MLTLAKPSDTPAITLAKATDRRPAPALGAVVYVSVVNGTPATYGSAGAALKAALRDEFEPRAESGEPLPYRAAVRQLRRDGYVWLGEDNAAIYRTILA